MSRFLLQGSLQNNDDIFSESCVYYALDHAYVQDTVNSRHVHRHDDIYEKVKEVVTVDQQYEEWCKHGTNHKRIEGHYTQFIRQTRESGRRVIIENTADLLTFCERYDARLLPSNLVWEDKSAVYILTNWYDNDD